MLHEVQNAFKRFILEDSEEARQAAALCTVPEAQPRIDIHRDNALISLAEVLKAVYPVVCAVTGEGFFRRAAREYVRAHPPRWPRLSAYGGKFEKFLQRYEPARPLPFLSGLARLEWAWNGAYFAADAAALDPAALRDVAPECYPTLRFVVHPSLRLVASDSSILRIWQDNRPQTQPSQPFDRPGDGRHVLVVRPEHEVRTHAIAEGAFTFILALKMGLTLEQAAAAATGLEPDFDLRNALVTQLNWSTLTGFSVAAKTERN